MKECTKCHIIKEDKDFYFKTDKSIKAGSRFSSLCKQCELYIHKVRSNKRKSDGVCIRCTSPDVINKYYCLICWFKKCASSCLGEESLYKDLIDLWHKQDKKCAVSGRQLIPNKNLSVDHILPKATHPHLANDINNIQLLDTNVNSCKNTLTNEEFKQLITDMYNNYIAKNKG